MPVERTFIAPPRRWRRALPRKTSGTGTDAATGGGTSDFLWGTKRRQGMIETFAKQVARTVRTRLGRQILRGLLGGIFGGLGGR